jgi:hypothetical protein
MGVPLPHVLDMGRRFIVGGLILNFGAGISATLSLVGPVTPVGTILAVRWPNKGWSRPVLPDHGELAASEQAQLEAARAKRGRRPISRALIRARTAAAAASSFCRAARLTASGAASAQLPPSGVASAASVLRRGRFCAGSRLPVRGSSLDPSNTRRGFRRAVASAALRTAQRRAAASDALRTTAHQSASCSFPGTSPRQTAPRLCDRTNPHVATVIRAPARDL